MKVVAFNGSPRRDGNTSLLLRHLLDELSRHGIGTELVQLSEKPLHGCIACYRCRKARNRQCAIGDDAANEYIGKMLDAEGIVLGSPVYFHDVTPELKALIDRAGFVSRANGRMFRDKVGASVVALRRAGGISSLDTINHFFLAAEMILVGRGICFGEGKGDVEGDEEGMGLLRSLGQRMAWLLAKIHA